MSVDTDALQNLGKVALVSGIGAIIIFSVGRRGKRSFRLVPDSAAEWLAFWFHMLEFLVVASFLNLMVHPPLRYGAWGSEVVLMVSHTSLILLLISIMAFWRSDRTLCWHALLWLLFLVLIGVALPVY
jgi:hypothetical protein